MPLRLGIIGVGGFGRFCLEQYLQLSDVRVTAIAGTQPAKYAALARQYGIPIFTTDWRELARHPDVDAVYLATPPDLHAAQALAAIAHGKHVFCEKPLALTLNEADAMLAAAARQHVRLGLNFVMRYNALYTLAHTLVQARALDAPQHFVFDNAAGDLPAGHWFWDPRRSGGIPVEHGVHFFDIFAAIYGPGTLRWAACTPRDGDADDKWLIVNQYAKNMFGSFYHAFSKPSAIERTRALFDFARGSFTLEGWFPHQLDLTGLVTADEAAQIAAIVPDTAIQPLAGGAREVLAAGATRTVTHRLTAHYCSGEQQACYAEAIQAAMRDFAAWVRDPAHRPRVTGADGRTALELALQAVALAHAA